MRVCEGILAPARLPAGRAGLRWSSGFQGVFRAWRTTHVEARRGRPAAPTDDWFDWFEFSTH